MVNREGYKVAIQQIWKTVQGVKIENTGDNKFIFQFKSALDRKRILNGGPWNFDRALIALAEFSGVGDISKVEFTKASFWVQIHNLPVICMTKEMGIA